MSYPVVLIVGPTGVGKSDFALQAAQKFSGKILNCDSLQCYQKLDIGTAKPSLEERALLPHLMFDVVPVGGHLTAGDFRRLALAELKNAIVDSAVFAVGGSGFYIQALEKGMFEIEKSDPKIEDEVKLQFQQEGLQALWQELEKKDPEYAEEISPNDSYRILRAIVVLREKGKKVSELRKAFKPQPFPYPLIKMGLECSRDHLRERIRLRTQKMLKAGLLEEVKSLIDLGLKDWPPLLSVGYRECRQVLLGEMDADKLESQIIEKTMQLAKKQMTWFRRDKDIKWYSIENDLNEPLNWLANEMETD